MNTRPKHDRKFDRISTSRDLFRLAVRNPGWYRPIDGEGPSAIGGYVRGLAKNQSQSMGGPRCDAACPCLVPSRVRGGFTLVDVVVSMGVIAVLIGLLIPTIGSVAETARRVACQSNVRQIGLGLVMYADQNQGYLPASVYLPLDPRSRASDRPEDMVTLRIAKTESPTGQSLWDGLGLLFAQDFLPAGKVFYCPSHRGESPYARYAPEFNESDFEIIGNYHFRGAGPTGGWGWQTADPLLRPLTRNLYMIDPSQSSLVADGMRVRSDVSHKIGANFFRADMTVTWYNDPAGNLATSLPDDKAEATASLVMERWTWFDQQASGEDE